MKRPSRLLPVALVALLVVAVPAMGLATVGDSPAENESETDDSPRASVTSQTNASVQANASLQANATADRPANATAPGQQLAGVVGVGEAELEGDLKQRSFGIGLATAASDQARANVIANHLGDAEARLADLEARLDSLEAQYEAGEIPEGKYNAKVAKIDRQIAVVSQLGNLTANATATVPSELLDERGIDSDRIRNLKENARNLTGSAVAEIARGIAGPGNGNGPGLGLGANGSAGLSGVFGDHPGEGQSDSDRPGNDRPPRGPPENPGERNGQ